MGGVYIFIEGRGGVGLITSLAFVRIYGNTGGFRMSYLVHGTHAMCEACGGICYPMLWFMIKMLQRFDLEQ